MSIRTLNDNVLVEVPKEKQTTASGLYIPETAQEGQVIYGIVKDVGPGKIQVNGVRAPVDVEIGQTIWFPKYNAFKATVDGIEYYVVPEAQILVVR